MKTISWRFIVTIALILTAVVYVLPTVQMVVNKLEQPTLWPRKQINLGLDLQGGMYLVLEVQTGKAVENLVDRNYNELRSFMRKNRVKLTDLRRVNPTTIDLTIAEAAKMDEAQGFLANEFRDYTVHPVSDPANTLQMTMKKDEIQRIKKLAAEKALVKIRNRVNEYGVREPDIRPQGANRILVQLPGIINPEKARKELGRTGNLEFKLVDDSHDLQDALRNGPPPGDQILYYRKDDPEMAGRPILLKKEAVLTGEYLAEARVRFDSSGGGRPYVAIKFNTKGARIFARVTEEHIKERLAIVLDNEVYSAPTIQSKIEGEGMITGNFTDESAKSLALVLREAFPTPVKILYEKSVGPSLGEDSIRKGLISMLIGGLLVVFFMVLYYKVSGLIANLALVVNILLIAGGLAAFGATLTLPGIAGIILTIGMAVDANVLIFERIREELRLGKTARSSVDAGFERATLTILDANVTTLIAALVLFQFGSSAVKGFAVTLSLGVVASVFTALVLCRAIFDFLLTQRRIKTLSI